MSSTRHPPYFISNGELVSILNEIAVGKKSKTFTNISMTSLLAHTVAQPTKRRILPKNLSQLVIFVIELAFT